VLQDNWSIDTHADVLTALAELPPIEPVWLPTEAAWLKWIEKLWRLKREQVLKLHRLAGDWSALRERVNAFLEGYADPPTGVSFVIRAGSGDPQRRGPEPAGKRQEQEIGHQPGTSG
jgi:hypothetical protein